MLLRLQCTNRLDLLLRQTMRNDMIYLCQVSGQA